MSTQPEEPHCPERFREVLQNIEEGYYEVDLKGRFTFVNEAMLRIIGLPPERLAGIDNRTYMDPASSVTVFATFGEVYRSGRPARVGPIPVQLGNGPARWFEFSVALIRDAADIPTGFRGLIHEITAIKQAEIALRTTTSRLEGLIQAIPDIIYFKDAERRNQIVNRAFEATFGLSQGEVAGKTDEELLPPDLAAVCRASDDIVFATGLPYHLEESTVLNDGRCVHFGTIKAPLRDGGGKVVGLIGVSRDITARREAERRIAESEERYRRLVENSLDGIYRSTPEGRFLNYNAACLRMFGFADNGEIEAVDLRSRYVDPSQRDRFLEVMARDGQVRNMEARLRRKDDSTIDVLINARRLEDETGRTVFEGILTDISAQKANESHLAAALAEKEVLIKEIHHRVKNNLQVISSLLSLQSRFLKHPDDIDLFKESQKRIRSMALIHEKLYQSKSLSRIEFASYTRRLVENLVASNLRSVQPIGLKAELEEVYLDIQTAIPCGLIVNELVMNALKHAFPGGRGGTIRLGLRLDSEGRVELTVGDDGVGLPPGMNVLAGDSMGMQIVTMLTQQLDGRLEIDRSPGTQFRLTFRELAYKPRL